ncbi:MAG: hypothetical protein WAV13_14145 [Thermodesulfovibrionales bacterium]
MTKLARKVEELFVDITFAEDRIFNPAQEALNKVAQKIEDTFTAIAFAEAGEFEAAKSYINKNTDGEAPKSSWSGYHPGGFSKHCTGRA